MPFLIIAAIFILSSYVELRMNPFASSLGPMIAICLVGAYLVYEIRKNK